MKPKLALAMIVKASTEELEYFEQCIKSISGHVDGIYITLNSTTKVPVGIHNKVEKIVSSATSNYVIDNYKWTGNFVKTRNDNFALVPEDFTHIVWVDSDDTIEHPEKMREVAAIMPKGVDGVYINYNYDHDDYGNVIVSHYVARLVRNNGSFVWKSSFSDGKVTVHETLNPVRDTGKVMNEEFWIEHHAEEERKDESLKRNIVLLEGMLNASVENPDARILYYLATHYIDANLYSQAKELFESYLRLSGWAEERSEAWTYLGEIYQKMGDNGSARGCFMRAMAENPKSPMPYVNLAELEIADKLWGKAVEWLNTGVSKESDRTATITRPLEATYRAYRDLAEAYTNLGPKHYEKALEWLKKAQKLRPYEPDMQKYEDMLNELIEVRTLTESTIALLNKLKQDKETSKIPKLLDNLPTMLQSSPLVASARNYFTKPVVWPKKSIAIVCGSSALGSWGPWSLEKGIGGSEEAVIQLSTILNGMGWEVTIYATPGEKVGNHDGVEWKHYWEFNSKDKFDVLIGWRSPSMFDNKYSARKTYLWLHDVVDREELFKERLDNINKVIFVSQYHRELYPFIPDDKCFASGNGIDPKAFEETDGKFERNTKRIVYMSAHERGQELLQTIWPKVKKAVPDAECDVYYGWQGYDEINKDNPERMAWKQKLIDQGRNLIDFRDNDKIGHEQIIEEIQKAGVWAYPTMFPEVYCITAAKAQAGGAWPVSSDFAVLDDMVRFGYKQHMEEHSAQSHVGMWSEKEINQYTNALIDVLKNPPTEEQRREMMEFTRKKRSWLRTAEGWSEDFLL